MDYFRFFSSVAPNVDSVSVWNEIKAIFLSGREIPYNMSFGRPDPGTFPFLKGKVTLKDGQTFDIDPEVMTTVLQYNNPIGYQPLIHHISAMTDLIHNPPNWNDRNVVVLNGSQEGLQLVFQMLVNKGDTVFVPMESYHDIFHVSKDIEPKFVSVKTDEDGILPDSLREALGHCKESKGVPKFLYVNPGGCNPTGSVLSESRRKIIYHLACLYDILIVEDDPYYHLQFNDDIPHSFLHLDTEGRVLRIESFSMILGAGQRMAFAVLPDRIARVLIQMRSGTLIHTSMFPQVMVSRLFDIWGIDGFLSKMKEICRFYRNQRDITLQAAERYLKGLCEWKTPQGGFFLWLKVLKLRDTKNLLLECVRSRDVILVPGSVFLFDHEKPSPFLRVSYQRTNEEEVHEVFSRLANVIKEEIKKQLSQHD